MTDALWEWLPEAGELDGKAVKLSRDYVLGITPAERERLIVELDGHRMRPWRGARETVRNEPGRLLGI